MQCAVVSLDGAKQVPYWGLLRLSKYRAYCALSLQCRVHEAWWTVLVKTLPCKDLSVNPDMSARQCSAMVVVSVAAGHGSLIRSLSRNEQQRI